MKRPDDSLEDFMLWTNIHPRRRWRLHWPSLSVWGAIAVFTLAFWTAVAWGIVTGMGL